jgi:hypothetical protein
VGELLEAERIVALLPDLVIAWGTPGVGFGEMGEGHFDLTDPVSIARANEQGLALYRALFGRPQGPDQYGGEIRWTNNRFKAAQSMPAVPEPTTVLLVGIGLALLAFAGARHARGF